MEVVDICAAVLIVEYIHVFIIFKIAKKGKLDWRLKLKWAEEKNLGKCTSSQNGGSQRRRDSQII